MRLRPDVVLFGDYGEHQDGERPEHALGFDFRDEMVEYGECPDCDTTEMPANVVRVASGSIRGLAQVYDLPDDLLALAPEARRPGDEPLELVQILRRVADNLRCAADNLD